MAYSMDAERAKQNEITRAALERMGYDPAKWNSGTPDSSASGATAPTYGQPATGRLGNTSPAGLYARDPLSDAAGSDLRMLIDSYYKDPGKKESRALSNAVLGSAVAAADPIAQLLKGGMQDLRNVDADYYGALADQVLSMQPVGDQSIAGVSRAAQLASDRADGKGLLSESVFRRQAGEIARAAGGSVAAAGSTPAARRAAALGLSQARADMAVAANEAAQAERARAVQDMVANYQSLAGLEAGRQDAAVARATTAANLQGAADSTRGRLAQMYLDRISGVESGMQGSLSQSYGAPREPGPWERGLTISGMVVGAGLSAVK